MFQEQEKVRQAFFWSRVLPGGLPWLSAVAILASSSKDRRPRSSSEYQTTAISINVVGLKQKAIRQDGKVIWEFFIINSSKSAMPRPFSEDLRWRAIWMKEMLGYQVDEVGCHQELSNVMS